MRNTTCFLLLFAILMLVGSLIATDDSTTTFPPDDPKEGCDHCSPNEDCCYDWNNNNGKPTCYDKQTHRCNHQSRLCPKHHHSCGKDCYNPALFFCYADSLISIAHNQCETNKGQCGSKWCCPTEHRNPCYNPNEQRCTAQGLIWKCFDYFADEKKVCSGHGECRGWNTCHCDRGYYGRECELGRYCLCEVKEHQCCWDLNYERPLCYDPKTHTCNNNGKLEKKKHYEL